METKKESRGDFRLGGANWVMLSMMPQDLSVCPFSLGLFVFQLLGLMIPRWLPQLQTSRPHTTVLKVGSRRLPEPNRDLSPYMTFFFY